jgi:hypothetical protein
VQNYECSVGRLDHPVTITEIPQRHEARVITHFEAVLLIDSIYGIAHSIQQYLNLFDHLSLFLEQHLPQCLVPNHRDGVIPGYEIATDVQIHGVALVIAIMHLPTRGIILTFPPMQGPIDHHGTLHVEPQFKTAPGQTIHLVTRRTTMIRHYKFHVIPGGLNLKARYILLRVLINWVLPTQHQIQHHLRNRPLELTPD